MLSGETIAIYCQNHTEHTDTVRISQETHYISTTEPNRLMLFGETVAVYCEKWAECTVLVCQNRLCIYNNSVDLGCERTIPIELPPLFGEVSANFSDRGVSRSQRGGSHAAVISVF
jgi:hypothetical protein